MISQLKKIFFFTIQLLLLSSIYQACSDGIKQNDSIINYYEGQKDKTRKNYQVPEKDPFMSDQWHLKNTTQTAYAVYNGKINEDINHDPVRVKKYTGYGVTVAVSDNGTEETHPDLRARINVNLSRNYSTPNSWHGKSSDNKGVTAIMAHGTATAGLIAAVDGNSIGVAGVSPRVSLATFRYVGTSPSYAKDIDQQNGPFDIFNYSYGRSTCDFVHLPTAQIEQYKYGVENLRNGLGAIYVKSGGNEYRANLEDCRSGLQGTYYGNSSLEEDQSTPYLVVVAAVNASGISSSYSTPGSSLWISAYGGEFGVAVPALITTDTTTCNKGLSSFDEAYNDFDLGLYGNINCDYTATMNGTSAAAPIISGGVAIILEANPNLSWRDVKYILAETARRVDPNRGATGHPENADLFNHTYQDGWTKNAADFYFHNWYGFGVLDLDAAVNMAENYQPEDYIPPLQETNWIHSSGNLNLAIPDSDSTGVTNTINVSTDLEIFSVQLMFTLNHEYAGDIGLELTSPGNTKSIMLNINSNMLETNINNGLLLSNAFLGESSKGNWTIKVIDGAVTDQGILTNWKLNFFGTSNNLNLTQAQESEALPETTTSSSSPQIAVDNPKEIKSLFSRINIQHLRFKSKLDKKKSLKDIKNKKTNLISKMSNSIKLKNKLNEKRSLNKNVQRFPKGVIDIKYDSKNKLIQLEKKHIPNYELKTSYKLCSDQAFTFIKNNINKISYYSKLKKFEIDLPSKEDYTIMKCNLSSIYLKNKRDIYTLNISTNIFQIISSIMPNTNIHFLEETIITESLDEKMNLFYQIEKDSILFPLGYAQLNVVQGNSLIDSNTINNEYLLSTYATSPITDSLLGNKSPLIVVLKKNEGKIISFLQLGATWQSENNIYIKNIIDIRFQDKTISVLLKTKDLKFHQIEITRDQLIKVE
jgi:subtilisin-like proprotein convertase family protein